MMGYLLFLFLLFVQAYSYQKYAFCKAPKHLNNFPTKPPLRHLPWVWDAIVINGSVHITVISRNACKFDYSQWQTLVNDMPFFKNELGYGLNSSILVLTDPKYNYILPNYDIPNEYQKGLQQEYLTCVFMNYNVVVAKILSQRNRGFGHAAISSLLFRCEIPKNVHWDRIRLERNVGPDLHNSTDPFPVCSQPELTSSSQRSYTHKVAICTATARPKESNLVEWIEYHRMLGVEHFYIYDTRVPMENSTDYESIRSMLRYYVMKRIVTVIKWPYQNCVRNMGSGRIIHYGFFFRPPRAISQTAALASCYSRFKHTTEWMIHVDDDEFMAFDPTKKLFNQPVYDLYSFASAHVTNNANTSAIYFKPLYTYDCRESLEMLPSVASLYWMNHTHDDLSYHALPRFGKWRSGVYGSTYEGKMMIRTEAVAMFYTHYLTHMEAGPWLSEPTTIDYHVGAILHCKIKDVSRIDGMSIMHPDFVRMHFGNTASDKDAKRRSGHGGDVYNEVTTEYVRDENGVVFLSFEARACSGVVRNNERGKEARQVARLLGVFSSYAYDALTKRYNSVMQQMRDE